MRLQTEAERIVTIDGLKISFLDVIRGLKSEAERVSRAVVSLRPDTIAMSVSREELEGLRAFSKEPFEIELTRYEDLYARHLARFGDVFMPPPCFLAAQELADESGAELVGIDMDDETHTEAYCAFVSGLDLLRHSTRLKLLKMRRFRSRTAEEFVLEWDLRVNGLHGFRELERERESFMAEELKRLSGQGRNMLAIIDLERAGNIRNLLLSNVGRPREGEDI